MPEYHSSILLKQIDLTCSGAAKQITTTSHTWARKVLLYVPNANTGASVSVGNSSTQLQVYAKNATYEWDFSGEHGAIDLSTVYINGTNNDHVYVTYFI